MDNHSVIEDLLAAVFCSYIMESCHEVICVSVMYRTHLDAHLVVFSHSFPLLSGGPDHIKGLDCPVTMKTSPFLLL